MLQTKKLFKFEIIYTLLTIILLIHTCPSYEQLNDFWRSYIANYYVINYDLAGGFIARGLIGSITSFFFNYINSKIYYGFFIMFYFMVYEVLGLLIIRGLKKSFSPELSFFITILMMYNSASINYMVDFARPDIYLVILTIIAMLLIRNDKFVILVPFLCIIGMLIHEGFIVIFVPVIATYLLFTYCKKKENMYIISFVLLVLFSICSFILIFKYGKQDYANYSELQALMQKHTDIPLNPNMLSFEHGPMKQDLQQISINELSYYKTIIALFFYVLLFFPLVLLYKNVLKGIRLQCNTIIAILYWIAPFSGLMMTFAGVDYGRWLSMAFTCLAIQAYFYMTDQKGSTIKGYCDSNEHSIIFKLTILLFIYLIVGSLGDIHEHFAFLEKINNFFNYIFFNNAITLS